MKLSEHFTLAELTRSSTAARKGIDNTPTDMERHRLAVLCSVGLEPVRHLNGGPIRVNSGFRGLALNAEVGGSLSSQHCCRGDWAAADVESYKHSNLILATLIGESDIPFDQLILEYPSASDPSAGWVHISILTNKKPRRQVLTALRVNGRTIYKSGLVVE